MKTHFYLYVKGSGTVRAVKSGSHINADEVEVGVTLNIPDALFGRPILNAEVIIPDAAAFPNIITAEVLDTMHEAIKVATGLTLNIKVENPAEALETINQPI